MYFCCRIRQEVLLYDAERDQLAIAKFLVHTLFVLGEDSHVSLAQCLTSKLEYEVLSGEKARRYFRPFSHIS